MNNQLNKTALGSGVDLTDRSTTLVTLWQTVRKHWTTALATALAVTLVATFYTLGRTRIYQASATLQFNPNPPRPLGKDIETVADMGAGNYWDNREYYETQYKIIQSMRVAFAVVQQLDLAHDASFMKNVVGPTTAQPEPVTAEEAAEKLRSRLSVSPVRDSRLVTVQYEDADPNRSQRILSSIIDTYVEQNPEESLASTNSAVDWLRGQLDKLKIDLESSEIALHEYKLKNNMLSVAFDDQNNMLREQIKQLNDATTSVQSKREEVSARRIELSKISVDNPSSLAASELLQSPLLQTLRQRYEESLRNEQALLESGKGAEHPDVKAESARVESAKRAIFAEIRNVQGAVESDFAALQKQQVGLTGLYEGARRKALDLNVLEIEYNRLRRARDNNEKLYQLVLERMKESDLARMMRVNNIHVLDRPLLPRVPIRPRVLINLVVGAIAGVLLGVFAAMGRALADRTIKTPDDIERELGLSFLGLLPEIGDLKKGPRYGRRRHRSPVGPNVLRKPELISHEFPTSGVAEAARIIRSNLLFMAPDKPFQVLLVTSAAPVEGKTTVASCIAISMAQAGQRVVLVDCDLRRPRIHRIFDRTLEVGVTTAIVGNDAPEAYTFSTPVPNLWVIPAGPIPPNPSELLHSTRFQEFLSGLRKRFDKVIIDSPPVVAVTDPAILSTLVDGTVLVVRGFSTQKDLAKHGVRGLLDVGGKMAGVVLNAVDLSRNEYQYYYRYKKDGYYAEPPTKGAAPDFGDESKHASPPS